MKQIPLPIAYNFPFSQSFSDGVVIRPIQVSIDLAIPPLSTATIVMPEGQVLPRGYYAKLYTPTGDFHYFRIRSPEIDYESRTITHELDHAVAEVGDWLVTHSVNGTYTAKAAIENIWGSSSNLNYRGNLWQLDTSGVSDLTEKNVTLSSDHEDVLTALNGVVDACPGVYMTFDYSTTPWTLGFAKFNSVDPGYTSYANLSRNVQTATATYDDTDLCTRVYYQKNGSWYSIDADQEYQDEYGIVERVSDGESNATASRAQYLAEEYLRKNCEPKISIEITAEELQAITGFKSDQFKLGQLLRFRIPEYDRIVERSITGLSWDDVYNNPMSATVTCGEDDPTLWGYVKAIRGKKR